MQVDVFTRLRNSWADRGPVSFSLPVRAVLRKEEGEIHVYFLELTEENVEIEMNRRMIINARE